MIRTCECEGCDLRSVFFKSFNETELSIFCNQKTEREYKTGDIIIREGDEIKEFTYLKSGLVKLFKTNDQDKDQIITIAEPFDFVSLLSVFSDSEYNYSVSALEDSVTCSLNLSDVKIYAEKNGLFSFNLMEKMSATSDSIILESLEIRNKNLKGKVAYILLKFGKQIYKDLTFEMPVSRKEVSEYIGVSTENVIRTLSEFRKDKLIRINGKEIEILDLETLKKISSFG